MKTKIQTKQKKTNYTAAIFIMLTLITFAHYIMKLTSGYNYSDGMIYVSYHIKYPLFLFGEYALMCLLLFPFVTKSADKPELKLYLLPLMLFAALGMMRVDASEAIVSTNADYTPSVMFTILFVTLIVMLFSKHTVTGAIGTIAGTLLCPAFGICYAPFITVTALVYDKETKKEHLTSVAVNTLISAAALVYAITKSGIGELSFSKNYIPVFLLVIALVILFIIRKDYMLIAAAVLPLFPLAAGILYTAFPTPIFTLAGSVAPLVMLFESLALTDGSKKIKGYAQNVVHNPAVYIIVAVFILYTAGALFVNPGHFRDAYVYF